MIQRSISNLNFVTSRDPMPTVEVQAESLEDQGLVLNEIISSALTRYAADNPTSKATVYTYGTMSVNFRSAGWSEFLIVAGDQKILKMLGGTFSHLPQVQSRFSDYLAPSQSLQAFHVEDGLLWRPEDALTWYAESPTDPEKKDLTSKPVETEEIFGDDADDWGDVIVETESEVDEGDATPSGRATEQQSRYRAARSDAKVARIRLKIE